MSTKNKCYEQKLKAKIALAALRNEESLTEICAENRIPKTNAIEWREKLIKEAESLFLPPHEKERKTKLLKEEIQELHKIIGEISVENNFLK